MTNSPHTWDKLLDAAPKGSVLMGGAVRDYYLDREAKDYDIFWPIDSEFPVLGPNWVYKYNADFVAHQAEYDIGAVQGGQENPIKSVMDYDVTVGKKYDPET